MSATRSGTAESMSNLVMDATPNMVLIVDRDMHIRECNKRMLDKLGISEKRHWSDIFLNLLRLKILNRCWKIKNPF